MRHPIRAGALVIAAVVAVVTLALVQRPAVSHAQPPATKTERFPQFDNEDVKVWKTVILPKQPLALHHHDHPRVIIALTGGTIQIVDSSGSAETQHWETGKAYWLPAMAPNTMHTDNNIGDKPMEVMVVELQKEK
jgi:quercetin dioxygenase-like cupin family protein